MGCTNLSRVSIPDSVTSIGESAFANCSSLHKIYIPDSVTHIGRAAFESCKNLTDLRISDSITSINAETYRYCSQLKEVFIPDSVITIERSAFYGCYNLRKIIIPDSVETIEEQSFQGCPIEEVLLPSHTQYEKNSYDMTTIVIKATVFISYSWDSKEHKKWVENLAIDLQKHDVHVTLDRKTLNLGDGLKEFMHEGISNAERVICIMTPEYKRRAEARQGGVGEEYSIIKDELCRGDNSKNKYIPILRYGVIEESFTEEFKDSAYLDFRNDDDYDKKLEELINSIFKRRWR